MTPSALDDADLLARLDRALRPRSIVDVDRSPFAYATSAPLERLRITLDDGGDRHYILKHLGHEHLMGEAPKAKDAAVHDPSRELAAYLLLRDESSLPRLLLHAADAASQDPVIVIEHVDGSPLWQHGEIAVWEGVAAWLGGFHRRQEARSLPPGSPLLDYCGDFFRARRSPGLPRHLRDAHDEALLLLDAPPRSIVHGDLYPQNIIVARRGRRLRVAPVDWEMAGVGHPLLDLAALTSGSWEDEPRQRMEAAYARAWGAMTDRAFRRTLLAARLVVAIRWVDWGDGWNAPVEHAHDWAAAAELTAAELTAAAA